MTEFSTKELLEIEMMASHCSKSGCESEDGFAYGIAEKCARLIREREKTFSMDNNDLIAFGYLHDSSLGPYSQVAIGKRGTTRWATKTWTEIKDDIQEAIDILCASSMGTISHEDVNTKITLSIAENCRKYLHLSSGQYGMSISEWLSRCYPTVKAEFLPGFNGTNNTPNVFYVFTDTAFIQDTPTQIPTCIRPWAVVRRSGI